jgi:hypothetical protein
MKMRVCLRDDLLLVHRGESGSVLLDAVVHHQFQIGLEDCAFAAATAAVGFFVEVEEHVVDECHVWNENKAQWFWNVAVRFHELHCVHHNYAKLHLQHTIFSSVLFEIETVIIKENLTTKNVKMFLNPI